MATAKVYYVRMHDKFMSGWGTATDRRSIYIVACDTLAQAEAIEAAAHRRSEMSRISICTSQPRLRSDDFATWKKFADLGGTWLQFYRPEHA
jgi:hypothetical protein